MQLRIVQVYREVRKQVMKDNLFGEKEANYIFKVFKSVLEDCNGIIMDLTAVITSNNLEMKDDERLKRIDALYNRIQEAYIFAQGFSNEIKLLRLQRKKEAADVQTSRILNDIKNE
jgi:hypothetical protein